MSVLYRDMEPAEKEALTLLMKFDVIAELTAESEGDSLSAEDAQSSAAPGVAAALHA